MSNNVLQILNQMDEGMVATLLIFGTGFIAALCWGLSIVVRALRSNVDNAAELRDEIALLEDRIQALEQSVHALAAPSEPDVNAVK